MLTFSKLGRQGHLGNQLFQVASTIGLAKTHNHCYGFKDWEYARYFQYTLPSVTGTQFKTLEETKYKYHEWPITQNSNYEINGYLQSEKYFDRVAIRKVFQFKEQVIQDIKNIYANAFKKPTILLSIRRGDFVDHPDYFQLPIHYYLTALVKHFSKWYDYNLIVLSDDITYCKFHFQGLENVYFGDNLNAIQQLCLGSLCDHFIISNSTFSWWSAWLGENKDSKVIVPIQNFRGQKAIDVDDSDYFPERWTKHNFDDVKIDIQATLFVKSSQKNLNIYKSYLEQIFTFHQIRNSEAMLPDSKGIWLVEPCYFPPMILVYIHHLYIQNNIAIKVTYSSKVSINKLLSGQFFKDFQDFGRFSRMFSFSKGTDRKHTFLSLKTPSSANYKTINLDVVGTFKNLSGFSYYFFLCGKALKMQLYRIKKKYLKF